MKSLARSLIAGSFVIASAARADVTACLPNAGYECPLFPPEKALPDVLYYIGAESNNFNDNEFGHKYYPATPDITHWQGIAPTHSRWSPRSGHPGYSYWFHVEHGVPTSGTSDEKSEVQLPFSVGPGQDFYFGISILLPDGYVSVSRWNLFFQLHSSMVLGSMVGLDTSPGMWRGVEQSALGVHYQSGDAHYEPGDTAMGLGCQGVLGCPPVHEVVAGKPTYYRQKFADIIPEKWNDIILHVKLSSNTRNITLNADGMLEVWHRRAGEAWTKPISQTMIVLGVTYSPKGMVADTYPRAGLYRDTWCDLGIANNMKTNCTLDTKAWKDGGSVPDSNPSGVGQPPETIYLDNIVLARTLDGAQSAFPKTDIGF